MPFVRPWSSKFIPYACLFLSGWTSLTYELIWIKQLRLVFGGTLYAISAVLCAFMTGLALGAWGISKYLQRPGRKNLNLVRLYGKLEAAIGLYALAFPFLLQGLTAVYPHLVDPVSGSDITRHGTEFILSTLLMLPTTFMMGATLPVIGSWSIGTRSANIFSNLSFLYALNTFGAVAGVLYTQFFGTLFLGIQGTNLSAVVLNGLVFFLCWFWQPGKEVEEPVSKRKKETPMIEEAIPSRGLGLLLLIVFGYSGLVALASEILWTRVLVFPLGSSLYSFAIILATFLFGLALGGQIPGGGTGHRLVLPADVSGVRYSYRMDLESRSVVLLVGEYSRTHVDGPLAGRVRFHDSADGGIRPHLSSGQSHPFQPVRQRDRNAR